MSFFHRANRPGHGLKITGFESRIRFCQLFFQLVDSIYQSVEAIGDTTSRYRGNDLPTVTADKDAQYFVSIRLPRFKR
jgi:hypothetical protein